MRVFESLHYMLDERLFDGWDTEKLEEFYEEGSRRDRKNVALHSLQIGVDAVIDDKIGLEEYQAVEESAVGHVNSYYNDIQEPELVLPDTEKTTRRSGFPGNESVVENYVNRLEHDVDKVVAIASGGLENGILASQTLEADLQVVRYSTNDHSDDGVRDWNSEDYTGEDVLVVDDTSYTGETLELVENYVEDQGAENVWSEAAVKDRIHGMLEVTKANLI